MAQRDDLLRDFQKYKEKMEEEKFLWNDRKSKFI
jgi:hypothetical protein